MVSLGLWGFIALADEVLEGETGRFDERILLALRVAGDPGDPLGPVWLEGLARDVTALGSMGVLTLVALVVVGFLLLRGGWRRGLQVAAAVIGGSAAAWILKAIFDRPRPDLVPHATEVYTSSFPSSHSMMAAVVYLTLGALLAQVQPRRRLKAYVLVVAAGLTVLVGVSRVYLGVHWPTDVLAGWSAGAAWAVGSWLVLRRLTPSPPRGPRRGRP